MIEKVIRFPDPDQRSRNPDAAQPRDPSECTIIVLPVVRIRRFNVPDVPRFQAELEADLESMSS